MTCGLFTKIVNLTPHEISILPEGRDSGKPTVIAQSGKVARCDVEGEVVFSLGDIPIRRNRVGEAYVLDENRTKLPFPDPEQGTIFIVSLPTAQALPGRADVLVPDMAVRDERGQVKHCRVLSNVAPRIS